MFRQRIRAFTLVELLVVIAIIGILIALLLPAAQAAREAARRAQCTNNVKQLALALHNYHDANKIFPTGSTGCTTGMSVGSLDHNWITRILPYIEQSAIYDQIDMVSPGTQWSPTGNTTESLMRIVIPEIMCPSDEMRPIKSMEAPTNYMASTGADERMGRYTNGTSGSNGLPLRLNSGIFRRGIYHSIANVRDGTSNTSAISECILGFPISREGSDWASIATCISGSPSGTLETTYRRGSMWFHGKYNPLWGYTSLLGPNDSITKAAGFDCEHHNRGSFTALGARSHHPGGVNVGMGDGTVQFVSETIDLVVWHAASTMAGGETEGL